ncbi:ARS binding protein 2-domain-containing protein [Zychaea mexicana]|uniref:ARS binding protein 2-domain-containing protein n=1 Tax=Zychaea mexicana TaxID=64656 RepID=UPI0022FF0EC0|nr:ARS binding protein 2-domain-containing protein [Zychaea mexicana]KAI9484852.1 ARS binding protein 2-domain-containing protein [Zychaea mexicana]
MNLSELIHRSADESPSAVHCTYDQFQPTPPPSTTAADAMQLYNNEVLESRFVTAKTNDEGMYSPAKLLPMSSPTTSSSSWHYNPATGESSRSPYASTLSDQSDRPRLLLPDSPPPPAASTGLTGTAATATTATTAHPPPPSSSSVCSNTTNTATITSVAALITRGGASAGEGGGTGGGTGTPASTDSPASPVPMDRLTGSPRFTTTGSPEFHPNQNHHHHHHHVATIMDNNRNSNSDIISSNNSIASLYSQKNNARNRILTITGQSVTKDNIEEGYVQFVLQHDPQSVNDSIESLMYVKRKFSSVPKTGDLSYTTWDVFNLVKKLHNQQIKNWSQLVGQLGLSDMTGRPQFAQRVKRWMRKYRIDCYFDYLLGNPYNFYATDDKSSGCLTMGNYQKRKAGSSKTSLAATSAAAATVTDDTDSVKSSGSGNIGGTSSGRTRKRSRYYLLTDEDDEDEEDDNNGTSDDEERQRRSTPIVLAGSRKRSRMSPHQHVSTESMRLSKALQENNHRLSEPDDDDHDDSHHHNYSRDADADGDRTLTDDDDVNDDMQDGGDDGEDRDNNSYHDDNEHNHINYDANDDEMDEGDEEDELASTSSSSTVSQSATTRGVNQRPNNDPIATTTTTTNTIPFLNNTSRTTTTTTAGPISSSSSSVPEHPSTIPSPSALTTQQQQQQQQPCSDCSQMQGTVHSLRNDVSELKTQVASLQARLDEELQSKQTMAKQISRFESMCVHYDNWRTKLAVHLLQNPFNMELMERKRDSSCNNTAATP